MADAWRKSPRDVLFWQKKSAARNFSDCALVERRHSLFLLAEDAHRYVENRRIVERHHAAVGAGFEVHAHALFGFVLAAEIVADGLHVDSQFVCDALRTAAGQFMLDTELFVKCDDHIG